MIEISWTDETDLATAMVLFESWITIVELENEFSFYTDSMMQYNKTIYNIDT